MSEPWYGLAFGAHYRAVYAHRDADEAQRCVDQLARMAPLGDALGRPVLDLGCGDGRHLSWLRASGLHVVGLDLSRPLLAAAAAALAAIDGMPDRQPLLCADMRRLPVLDGALASVLSLFTAFGYFGRSGDAAMIAAVAAALADGGHWFLDYLNADLVRTELTAGARTRDRIAGPLMVRETRRLEPEPPTVVKDVQLTVRPGCEAEASLLQISEAGLSYSERVALYRLDELDAMAAGAGLRRVAASGDYGGAPLGTGARWLLVYRKDPVT